ncbi:nuclear transport factor 2 family protein [Rhodoferax sp.]|uniref:nuclear transport factor 2 family protein n=1 Tax=Rhodoferax sp. TaxID=50421 RepID=UPI00272F8058|nr:nuclear transport factor 2 family protein [Rhodoferax sp.]MDP2443751.1 nuclear transport factor 2 family protein [Rhodoferax sp.]MDZ4207772.1 nuclear transport factor 2 family protein [Rhodoferax sp.]
MTTPEHAASAGSALAALGDREAIRDCLYRYCRGIDRADEEALRSAYWHDATDQHGAYQGSATGFIDQALARLRKGGRRVHMINNILIELHGPAAAVESNFIALQTRIDAQGVWHETFLCGRYVDRFERRAGIWRVAARTVVYDWLEERSRPELADPDTLFGVRQPVGGQAPLDPIYQLLRSFGGN